ncbi:hypothetical protein BB472_08140 [Helicobacter pylori]|nr:hypothetical protein BB472_08140 [Helicobacter pylori]
MGFQNENKLKVGASVKATINDKVVEAKVISIGFNRVTLRSQKGNEASYVFNSDKFLKWFNKVPLTEHMKIHAENKKADILDGVKVVTSGPSVKDRTSTPKESKEPKESRFKLDFDSLMIALALLWSLLMLTLTKKEAKDLVCYSRR